MASYKVRDRSGGTLRVWSKAQADKWVGLGYALVDDKADAPEAEAEAKPAVKKSTAKKSAAKSSDKE